MRGFGEAKTEPVRNILVKFQRRIVNERLWRCHANFMASNSIDDVRCRERMRFAYLRPNEKFTPTSCLFIFTGQMRYLHASTFSASHTLLKHGVDMSTG